MIFILVMVVLLIIFTIQNPHPVRMHLVAWEHDRVPLIAVVLVSFLAGVAVSIIFGLVRNSKLKRVIQELRNEIDELKTPPVYPE
jgi:uncharacterized integral membrane protein